MKKTLIIFLIALSMLITSCGSTTKDKEDKKSLGLYDELLDIEENAYDRYASALASDAWYDYSYDWYVSAEESYDSWDDYSYDWYVSEEESYDPWDDYSYDWYVSEEESYDPWDDNSIDIPAYSTYGNNVALNAIYAYNEGIIFGPVEGEEGFDDSACTRLTDGFIPNGMEKGGKTVGIVGTGATVILTIDLGKYYTDITEINFLCVCDSLTDGTSNRGFSGEDTKFKFSASGYEGTFERVKDFSMEKVDLDGDEKTYFFNYNFKFDTPVAARYVEITMNAGKNPDTLAQGFVLSLGEIEIR